MLPIPAVNTAAANANNVPPLPPVNVAPGMFMPSMVPAVNLNGGGGGAMYGGFPPQPLPVPSMFNPAAAAQVVPPPAPTQTQGPPQDNTVLQQQILILQTLQAQGIPQSEWPKILAAITSSSNVPVPPPNFAQQQTAPLNGRGFEGIRSPPGNHYGDRRSRSRSPRGNGRRDGSPNGRYRSPNRNDNGRNRRNGRNDRRSPSPQRFSEYSLPPAGPKWIDFDQTVPKHHIKVYSRTLFVGGVKYVKLFLCCDS